ncbi:MAG: four helix bundle protein [Chloroflexota bacterium]|jgi:four helix bundle protein
MSKVTRFEELIAWQKARQLAKDVYMVSQSGKFASDFGLRDQIQRAVVSIMANIAEGFERNRAGEFHQFLSIAKASCAEVRSHLYIAFDIGYIEQAKFEMLLTQAEEVGRVIGGLRSAVSRTRDS